MAPLRDESLLRSLGNRSRRVDRQRDGDEGDECQQRRDREHHDQNADDREQRREHLAQRLLQALGDVVDVVGDPAQEVATGLAVDVAQRKAIELVLDPSSETHHRALHDPGEQVALQIGKRRGPDVEPGHDDQRAMQLGVVDAGGVAEAGDDDVGGLAEDLRPQHEQRHRHDREGQHEDRAGAFGSHLRDQPGRGAAEVLALLGGHAGRREPRREGRARLGRLQLLGLVLGIEDRTTAVREGIAHAASSADICEATISA